MKNLIIVLVLTIFSQLTWANNNPEPISANVIAFSGLKLRATPGSDGKVLDIISFGEKVTVLEVSEKSQRIEWVDGHWIKVSYLGSEGFVFDGFLTSLPLPSEDFELTQNDLDIAYPLLAWAENHFDQVYEADTFERANHIKTVQYLENGIVMSREDSEHKFNSTLELPDTKISDAYNLVKSMLLTKNERKVFEDSSLFIKNRDEEIYKIKIDIEAPVEITRNKDGSVKINVSSYHEGCGF